MKKSEITVIICCAGMGTRLGIGTTKALLDIKGKPLILRQLELLEGYDDIRIVVGFQAQKVIETVTKYRKDVMFAFNHDYKTTGVASSLNKGLIGARKYIVYMDGDILINQNDFKHFMEFDEECLAYSEISSDEPVQIKIKKNQACSFLIGDKYCWPGLAKVLSAKIRNIDGSVYDLLEPFLPMQAIAVRSREIDTADDYERALLWVTDGNV